MFLKDIWPTEARKSPETDAHLRHARSMFEKRYADVFDGDDDWKEDRCHRRTDLLLGTGPPPTSSTRRTSTACQLEPGLSETM